MDVTSFPRSPIRGHDGVRTLIAAVLISDQTAHFMHRPRRTGVSFSEVGLMPLNGTSLEANDLTIVCWGTF